MMFRDLVMRARSFRRFKQQEIVPREHLLQWIDLARQAPSGGNQQPLKYHIINDPARCAEVFPNLRWAGALKDWEGPAEGERPAAYIVVLLDRNIKSGPGCDQGIAGQTIQLAAAEDGYGCCMIGSIDRDELTKSLQIPSQYEIVLILAIGRPAETILLEDARDGNITYYRDEQDQHHVPKRPLREIVIDRF